jgi:hypothetical protein
VTDEASKTSVIDLTAAGVEFAPWATIVENDELHLGRLSFDIGSPLVTFPKKGITYDLPPAAQPQARELEAFFISTDRETIVQFSFNEVIAFRVLDEGGLLELWEASASKPRPAQTTFRARGHAWADESLLVFLGERNEARFSYFVATDDMCVEVVCLETPEVKEIGAAVIMNVAADVR